MMIRIQCHSSITRTPRAKRYYYTDYEGATKEESSTSITTTTTTTHNNEEQQAITTTISLKSDNDDRMDGIAKKLGKLV